MVNIFKKYFLYYWVWWYWINHKAVIFALFNYWWFMLSYLNVLPMLTNLFQPMFQDTTRAGRFIAFPIRLTWVVGGSLIQLIITIPLLGAYIFYIIAPLLPVFSLIEYLYYIST